jgi:4'-phosphopantetheinyl transferase
MRDRIEESQRLRQTGRSFLHALLAHYVPQFTASQLAIGPHGKPYLPEHPLHFNLSHSGDCIALALADVPVGLDVERLREQRDFPGLLQRVFHPVERERMRAHGQPLAAFYQAWTRKEAFLKALGTGISFRLQACAIEPLAEGWSEVRSFVPLVDTWWVHPLQLAEGHAAALCLRASSQPKTPIELRQYPQDLLP